MSKHSEESSLVVRTVVAVALISSAAAAAILLWARLPATRSRRIINRCDDAITELEHRKTYDLQELRNTA